MANAYLMLFRDESASYVDLASGKKQDLYACSLRLQQLADRRRRAVKRAQLRRGVRLCNYPMQTSFALAPTGREELAGPAEKQAK